MKILYLPLKQIETLQKLLQAKNIDETEKKVVEIIEGYCKTIEARYKAL